MNSSTTNLVLAPDALIDLQTHTTYSDGTWEVEQLIDHLVSEGFGLAAITDHDRVDTIAAVQKLAHEKGLPILPALEITCIWKNQMTDMLCFGVDPNGKALKDLTESVLQRQRENTKGVYEGLLKKGFVFPEDSYELTAILEKPSARQPRELVELVKRYGYDTPQKSAGRIVAEEGCSYISTEVAIAVDAVHQSGGLCILAHPGRDDGFICYDVDLLDQLRKEVPIDGLEAYYPVHTPEQTAMYEEYARKHDLLTSSGSDSHGPEKKPIQYRAEPSRKLLERLGIQVK